MSRAAVLFDGCRFAARGGRAVDGTPAAPGGARRPASSAGEFTSGSCGRAARRVVPSVCRQSLHSSWSDTAGRLYTGESVGDSSSSPMLFVRWMPADWLIVVRRLPCRAMPSTDTCWRGHASSSPGGDRGSIGGLWRPAAAACSAVAGDFSEELTGGWAPIRHPWLVLLCMVVSGGYWVLRLPVSPPMSCSRQSAWSVGIGRLIGADVGPAEVGCADASAASAAMSSAEMRSRSRIRSIMKSRSRSRSRSIARKSQQSPRSRSSGSGCPRSRQSRASAGRGIDARASSGGIAVTSAAAPAAPPPPGSSLRSRPGPNHLPRGFGEPIICVCTRRMCASRLHLAT